MAAEITETFGSDDVNVVLIPGDAGAFEITNGRRLVFSKHREDRFPAYQEITNLLAG